MKNKKLNLPILLEFRDYHEIDYVLDFFKEVIPNIKAKELDNYCEHTSSYGAIFYAGSQKDKVYLNFLNKVKKDLKLLNE